MANVDNTHGFVYEMNLYGGPAPVWQGKLKSNITVAIGDALYNDGSGYVTIATSSTSNILGVCLEAISSTGSHPDIDFVPALDGIVFSAQCSSGSTPSQGLVWTNVDIEGTTGIMEINEDSSTYDTVRLLGFRDDSSIGNYAQMMLMFNKTDFGGEGRIN